MRGWVKTSVIFGSTLMGNQVSKVIYEDFLPAALAIGQFVPAPQAHVIGHGLDQIQASLDLHRKGVSAEKLVVAL